MGISICISAWKTQKYIEECLDSVYNQTWFKDHDEWEVIIGIDGCEETLKKVKEIKHKYKNLRVFMMDSNQGTYITCNTIMKETKYDWLFRFDSDDIMLPTCVETMMKYCENYDLLIGNIINFGMDTKDSNQVKKGVGHQMIRKSVFFELNGYDNYRISMDSDLIKKIRKFYRFKHIETVIAKRRQHEDSLTCNKDTCTNILKDTTISKKRLEVYTIIKNPLRYSSKSSIKNKTFVVNTYREIK